jgi:ribosomal protein S18 acetylase RimI-like enzyme
VAKGLFQGVIKYRVFAGNIWHILLFIQPLGSFSLKTNFVVDHLALMLRPVDAGDEEFIYQVYASTREAEMALVDWTAEQKTAFLRMQVNAQTDHYKNYYPHARYHVIQRDGVPVGRLITDQSLKNILIIDIALLPEYRNARIGTAVMQNLMNYATEINLPVILRVEFFNPALNLYARLGFVKTGEMTIYHEMTWTPVQVPV